MFYSVQYDAGSGALLEEPQTTLTQAILEAVALSEIYGSAQVAYNGTPMLLYRNGEKEYVL